MTRCSHRDTIHRTLTPRRFLAAHAEPHSVLRLGRARLARIGRGHSRDAWSDEKAGEILAAAGGTLRKCELLTGCECMEYGINAEINQSFQTSSLRERELMFSRDYAGGRK